MEEDDWLNWDKLPVQFKIDVATSLDNESKTALQLTSSTNQELVSHCPTFLNKLTIRPIHHDHAIPVFSEFLFKAYPEPPIFYNVNNKRRFIRDLGIEEFVRIFRNKKTRISELKFISGDNLDNFLANLACRLNTEKENFHKIKLRIKEISLEGCMQEEIYANFFKVLEFVDVSTLKSIRIDDRGISPAAIRALIETEQFQHIKKLAIRIDDNVPFEKLLHLETIDMKTRSVRPEEVVMLVERFLRDPLPDRSSFLITLNERLDKGFLTKVFDLLGVPNTTEARKSLWIRHYYDKCHISKYPAHAPYSYLLLKIDWQSVYGLIKSDFYDAYDFKNLVVYMSLSELRFDWKRRVPLI